MKKSVSTAFPIAHRGSDIELDELFKHAREDQLRIFVKKCKNKPSDYHKWLHYASEKVFQMLYQDILSRWHVSMHDIVCSISADTAPSILVIAHEYIYRHFLCKILEEDDVSALKKCLSTGYLLQTYTDRHGSSLLDIIRKHKPLQIWKYIVTECLFTLVVDRKDMDDEMWTIWTTHIKQTYDDDIFQMIYNNDLGGVKTYITQRGQVNIRNFMGVSPLFEAVRLRKDDIADVLRDAGAMFSSFFDIDQQYVGSMTKKCFFERLTFVLRSLVPRLCSIQIETAVFFHSVKHSNRLFCCSVKYQREPSDENVSDFSRRLTHYVIEQYHDCMGPLCREFRMHSIQVPVFFQKELLGIIYAFSYTQPPDTSSHLQKTCSDIFFQRFEQLEGPSYETLWNDFLLSSSFFIQWLEKIIVYSRSEQSCIFFGPVCRLVSLIRFLKDKLAAHHRRDIEQILMTHAVTTIPYTKLSNEIYTVVYPYREHYVKSFLMSRLETGSIRYTLCSSPVSQKVKHPFSHFDIFEVLGDHHEQKLCGPEIAELNTMLDDPVDFSLETIGKIRRVLGMETSFRTTQVIGTVSKYTDHYRIFMPVCEVSEAMEVAFRMYPTDDVTNIVSLYKIMVEWIHPFLDGNGRTFRLLLSVLLRSRYFNVLITKGDTQITQCT